MKKISLFILTMFALFTTTAIVHADSNQLNITGYITNTDIKNKTITISNDNKKDFIIDKVPTKYLIYDKTKRELTITASESNNKLVFDRLHSAKTNNKSNTNHDSNIINNLIFSAFAICTIVFVLVIS